MKKITGKPATRGQRALDYYYDVIQHQLTDADKGRYIAIDVETLEWEIADTREAEHKLRTRIPDAYIVTLRHIYIASTYWGAAPPEVRDASWFRPRSER